jgi:hypothetical protein
LAFTMDFATLIAVAEVVEPPEIGGQFFRVAWQ